MDWSVNKVEEWMDQGLIWHTHSVLLVLEYFKVLRVLVGFKKLVDDSETVHGYITRECFFKISSANKEQSLVEPEEASDLLNVIDDSCDISESLILLFSL